MAQIRHTSIGVMELVAPVIVQWRSALAVPVVAIGLAYGATFLMTPVYTATTVFIPPQQQQSAAATALTSLGAIAGLAGPGRSPAEQYAFFLQSANATDRIIDRFHLKEVYNEQSRDLTRKTLLKSIQINLGKKDGLITLNVDDHDPARAAAMANAFVAELRRMTSTLAVTEAQQRRLFFEGQLHTAKTKLTDAQRALQASGISAGTLKTEPKAAAEGLARVQAQLTSAEIALQVLRNAYAERTTEVQNQLSIVRALRSQLDAQERADDGPGKGVGNSDYISRYREFKYLETLFDLLSRQFEAARVDEAREGAVIQIVDAATVPERKSQPIRSKIALSSGFFVAVIYALYLMIRARLRPKKQALIERAMTEREAGV